MSFLFSGDTKDAIISDFTLGLMDGLTVPVSVASGLVAAGQSREIVMTAIIAEAIAGSISMGLSDYVSVDTIEARKDNATKSAIRVTLGYLLGSSIPFLSYLVKKDVKEGFKLSIILNVIALVIFGNIRAKLLNVSVRESMTKVVGVGLSAMILTYIILKMLKPKCTHCKKKN